MTPPDEAADGGTTAANAETAAGIPGSAAAGGSNAMVGTGHAALGAASSSGEGAANASDGGTVAAVTSAGDAALEHASQAAMPPVPSDPPPPTRSGDPAGTLATALRSHAEFTGALVEHGPSIGWPGKLIELAEQAGRDLLAAAEHFEQFVGRAVRRL